MYKSQPLQLFFGIADMSNRSALKQLISPVEIPSLNFQQNNAVDMFPEIKHLNIICWRYEFRVRYLLRSKPASIIMALNIQKKSTNTTVHRICRYLEQFGCKAYFVTSGDTIIELPKEHCYRYVPGDAEARKTVALRKDTSQNAGNNDATTTSLASVSEKICVSLSMPEKPYHQKTQSPPPKNHTNDMPVLSHSKMFEVAEDVKDFLIHDSGK